MSRGVTGFSGATARRARTAARLTADQLGLQVGVSEQTILRWENGTCAPTADHLRALADQLDVSIPDLLLRKRATEPTLRDLRHMHGISLSSAAKGSGLSASAVVRLERGISDMQGAAAASLAEAYQVGIEEVAQAHRMTRKERSKEADAARHRAT